MHNLQEKQNLIPILPLRDSIIYPFMVVPLFVNRPKSIQALETSVKTGKQIFFVAQKDPKNEDPQVDGIYEIGTVANILQVLKLPDGTIKVLAEGINRGKIKNVIANESLLIGEIEIQEDIIFKDNETEALVRALLDDFGNYVKLTSKIPPEIVSALSNINEPGRLADAVVAHLPLVRLEDKQKILETQDTKQRLHFVIDLLLHEFEVLQVEEKLKHRVKSQLDKTQREFYLNEKLKAIQKELDEVNEGRQPLSDAE